MINLNYPIIIISFLISFYSALILTPYWIKRVKKAGITGKDIQKLDKPEIAELGGIIVIISFMFGTLFYLALDTFYLNLLDFNVRIFRDLQILATLLSITLVTIIGLVDDILGWKIGLRQWQKPFLVMIAALPISVLGLGSHTLNLPLLGQINFGLIYPFLIIPLAISGAANGFNMLAGYNGLESGLGIIILSALGFMAWIHGNGYIAVFTLCFVFALIGFYVYNKFPSKIFPGDSLTYPLGALIAIIAILGSLQTFALIIFIPYFIEFFLKLRGKFKKESFAKVNPDGSLQKPYAKYYGLEHISITLTQKLFGKAYEKEVVYLLYFFQLLMVSIAFIIHGLYV